MIALLMMAAQAAEPAASGPPPTPPAHVRHAPGDPLEGFNRKMYKLSTSLDRAIFRPAAMGYKHVVPRFVRSALRHFFSNLTEPVVALNYVLQHKIGKAAETAARFTINSTVGLAGTIDVAKEKGVNLPHRPNGLGDTLGFYGVKPGPYLFLPFLGPSDLRDLLGNSADGLVLPTLVGKPFNRSYYQIPKTVITGLDTRVEFDRDMHALLDSALDPYATLRSVYLQDRAGEIAALKGESGDAGEAAGAGELADPMADPAGTAAPPAASKAPELQDPLGDPAAPVQATPPAGAADAPATSSSPPPLPGR